MFGLSRFLGPGTCLALVVMGCTGSSRPPPARTLDSGATPNAAAGPAAAASGDTASAETVVNVYNWSDFIDPSVIPAFEREYGIKVNYDVFDSNEELETKLLVGQSNYDVVVPAAGRSITLDAGNLLNDAGRPVHRRTVARCLATCSDITIRLSQNIS